MQRILLVIVAVFAAFVFEGVLAQLFGPWGQPSLLILLIVFFNLFRGIRYSLFAAILGGLLRDSYSVRIFGLNTFAFVACAYMTTLLKWYFYRAGSPSFRVVIVFLISLVNVLIHYALQTIYYSVNFGAVFTQILLPEVILTTALTNYVFDRLKQCALKYSV